MFRFLLSARWLGFLLFVIVLAALSTRLGFWQLQKLESRLDRNDIIEKHFAADPVDLRIALPDGKKVRKSNEWTRVTATGTYDVDHQVTVKFTIRDGAPGVDVVTPLVLDTGEAVLVNRGWIQTQNTVDRPDVPPPPGGQVMIEGWLRQNNGAGDDAVKPVDSQVRAVSSTRMADFVPYPLIDGYINLQDSTPPPSEELAVEPMPELGQGPHFFYALQWWFFALLAVVGYFWFARAEAKERKNPSRVDGFPTRQREPAP